MATIKNCTDLPQSKKLAEILPIESADMCYKCIGEDPYDVCFHPYSEWREEYKGLLVNKEVDVIPCWSLAALLDLLPNNEHIETNVSRGSWKIDTVEYVPNTWWCEYEDNKNQTEFNISADNPVDACVDMILKLKEKNLL